MIFCDLFQLLISLIKKGILKIDWQTQIFLLLVSIEKQINFFGDFPSQNFILSMIIVNIFNGFLHVCLHSFVNFNISLKQSFCFLFEFIIDSLNILRVKNIKIDLNLLILMNVDLKFIVDIFTIVLKLNVLGMLDAIGFSIKSEFLQKIFESIKFFLSYLRDVLVVFLIVKLIILLIEHKIVGYLIFFQAL